MKFDTMKCIVVHLETNKNFCYELAAHSLETAEEKKYQGGAVSSGITMTYQYDTSMIKANAILKCIT